VDEVNNGQEELYQFSEIHLTAVKNGKEMTKGYPQRRFYFASQQTSTEIALYSTFREDLYMVFEGFDDNDKAVIHILIKPLVMFIWLGGIVVVLGTVIALFPDSVSISKPGIKEETIKAKTADAAV
jgi:cytochrome c-type biogenesis protein CcmF